MQEYTTTKGKTIRTGQRYHDRRQSNRRTLEVRSIGEPWCGRADDRDIECAVIAVDGQAVPERITSINAIRITGRDYILIEQAGAAS
ncbi:hypothetical protein ACWEKR_05940 [Nocardia sp. NPDC004573]